jgi:hypothetical protein
MANPQTAQNQAITIVRFMHLPVKDEAASKKAGRYIGEDIEVCEIRFSGNREKVHVAPAHEVFRTDRDVEGHMTEITYAIQYNTEYLAFKAGNTDTIRGTPTSELPFLGPAKILMLKALNIHTAEALAALDGASLKQLGMGGRELKVQAQTYLDNAAGSADVLRQASLIEKLEEQNKLLRSRLAGEPDPVDETGGAPVLSGPEDPNASPFFAMEPDDIKNWIKEATGERPLGNPSHATLVKRADEVNAAIKAKRESVAA